MDYNSDTSSQDSYPDVFSCNIRIDINDNIIETISHLLRPIKYYALYDNGMYVKCNNPIKAFYIIEIEYDYGCIKQEKNIMHKELLDIGN